MKKITFLLLLSILISCKEDKSVSDINSSEVEESNVTTENDSIIKSKEHILKDVICDLDGDNKNDTVQIVQNINNKKYGLKFSYANQKIDFLGMGKDVIDQGFDDFDWIGEFSKVNKGEIYWNNVTEEGDIIVDENEVEEKDKIRLENDGIYIHEAEACGGGIIYLQNGKYNWIQQE